MSRRVLFVLMFPLWVGADACRCRPVRNHQTDAPPASVAMVFAEQPIYHCTSVATAPKGGRVAVLIDASGSMAGFRNTLPHLVPWLDLAISRLRDDQISIEGTSLCQFTQPIGIGECRPRIELGAFHAHGSTNLHDAIHASQQNDLTFILTDGIAAASENNAGNCAAAVDAACVARALAGALHSENEAKRESDRGLWVIPLVAPFDGVFYTEKRIDRKEFNAADTASQIKTDFDVDIAVKDVRNDSHGDLNYIYRGPRALLLIVIARTADLGRSAVAALSRAREQSDISGLAALKTYTHGIAAFDGIELYPGIVHPVVWKSAVEPQDVADSVGTFDASLQGNTMTISCPQKRQSEQSEVLTADEQTKGGDSLCAPIWSLPGFEFRLRPTEPDTDVILASFIKSYEPRKALSSKPELYIRLLCGGEQESRPCGKNPLRLSYTASANYAATGQAVDGKNRAFESVHALSTLHPEREPHRIFAFADMLQTLYAELAHEQYRVPVGELTICHDDGKHK